MSIDIDDCKPYFPGASKDDLVIFRDKCERLGVHPADNVLVPLKDRKSGRVTFISTIDLLRRRAESSGAYLGNSEPTFNGKVKSNDYSCTVTVRKIVQGQVGEFSATARWDEYAQQSFIWKSKPHVMLAKCAEALALRKAFPGQLSGLYTGDEIERPEPSPHEGEPNKPPVGMRTKIHKMHRDIEQLKRDLISIVGPKVAARAWLAKVGHKDVVRQINEPEELLGLEEKAKVLVENAKLAAEISDFQVELSNLPGEGEFPEHFLQDIGMFEEWEYGDLANRHAEIEDILKELTGEVE